MRNMGTLDRLIRALAGLLLLALCFYGPRTELGLFGLVPLTTAVVGVCPIYSYLGISTWHPRGPPNVHSWHPSGARDSAERWKWP